MRRWLRSGRLIRLGNGLYALGHCAVSETTHLHEALLIAGPGAALDGGTNLWWRDLIRFAPKQVQVSAPGRRRSTAEVAIRHPAEIEREWYRGLPVTSLCQALLDAPKSIPFTALRRAVAQIDARGLMSLDELEVLAGSGRRGSAPLRQALRIHMPELACTRSPLEDRFLYFCEAQRIPLPKPNFVIAGYEVDAVWPDLGVAVELDGREEHGTPAAVTLDRRRELAIRGAGFELLRYGSEQIDHKASDTAQDLRTALARHG